ncbi:hypothetical protein BDA96_10G027700 [Sorghum bicolor]|uniref:Uncharacterized protein n=1 Tax=Sorghum bicolor TaxID=4558 RepID=A0A921TZS7_SORBI|nr:hypothetical protein BDA96_10G027700 [Sorghum bicolor]
MLGAPVPPNPTPSPSPRPHRLPAPAHTADALLLPRVRIVIRSPPPPPDTGPPYDASPYTGRLPPPPAPAICSRCPPGCPLLLLPRPPLRRAPWHRLLLPPPLSTDAGAAPSLLHL